MGCSECEKINDREKEDDEEDGSVLGWPFKDKKARRIFTFTRMAVSLTLALIGSEVPNLNQGWVLSLVIIGYVLISYDVFLASLLGMKKGSFLDEHFLMIVGTVGAMVISSYTEAVFVMIFYHLGEILEDVAEDRSKKSIANLVNNMPLYAHRVIKGSQTEDIDPKELSIGNLIKVLPGEKIPVDGIVRVGTSSLDMSSLTGESLPKAVSYLNSDQVYSGSVNTDGVLIIEVSKLFKDSTLSQIMDLIRKEEGKKSKSERFISRFSKVYTPVVVLLSIAVFLIIYGISGWGGNYQTALYDACNMLIISCPCALIVSIPLAFFISIGKASKYGILIKGGSGLEKYAKADSFIFDKTGTLTEGTFQVLSFTSDRVLNLSASLEKNSTHPIALSIMKAADKENLEEVTDFKNVPGSGIQGKIGQETYYLGDADFASKEAGVEILESDSPYKTLYLSKNGAYLGSITISDVVKANAKQAISQLRQQKVRRLIMLSGDSSIIANKVGSEVGLDEEYGDLLPQDKIDRLAEIKAQSKATVFVGDGVNDAPSLLASDCGTAMGGLGSDAAKESAEVVILDDNLEKVPLMKKIGRKTMKIVYENLIGILAVKAAVLILAILSLSNMYLAMAADTGTLLLAILNSLRLWYGKK